MQTFTVLIFITMGYLYMMGIVGSQHSNKVIKRVTLYNKPIQKETANIDSDPVMLTYYPPNPRYKLTNFQRSEPTCYGEACDLNMERTKIEVTPLKKRQCVPLSKCLTVNIKTRHRYKEVKEFVDSIHFYYPALKIVVLDEFNPEYENTKWAKIVASSPLITYAQVKPGVGYGRMMAARLSSTKYILVADDDYKCFDKTNISKLVDVMENSDADIVAGTTDDNFPFAGAIRVSSQNDKCLLSLYPGVFYGVIPNYKNCYQADIVKTFFVARRDAILDAGSWDVSRPFYEHEDFFFQMRKSRLKIAYCDDVIVQHMPKSRDLAELRHTFFEELKTRLMEKWKIDDYFSCTVPMTYLDMDTCPAGKRKHFQ